MLLQLKKKATAKAPVQTKEVQAESNFKPYVSVKGAYAKTSMSSVRGEETDDEGTSVGKYKFNDHTYGVRVAVGAKFDAIRSELEFGWNDKFSERHSDFDEDDGSTDSWKNSFKTKTIMLNGYYDLFTNNGFTPYVGVGVGLSHNKMKLVDSTIKESDNSFAWQVGAGVTYDVCDNMAIDVGYRYMDYGSVRKKEIDEDYHSNIKAKLKTNEVLVGVRYSF
ncbi:MAG: porin family protein [Alphaproteobacteria bacterium]|nr:porin family protein [Alphaproteobacteria bacterium]